jgi:hypothetical protein
MLDDLRASTQRLEDLVFKLGTLNELVELSARSPKIEDLLPSFLHTTMRAVHAGAGSIMLLDYEKGRLRAAASRGFSHEISEPAEVALGEGIAGKVAALGDAIVIESMEKDARFTPGEDARPARGSFICMPLRAGDRVVGVMSLVRKEDAGTTPPTPRPFSTSDLQFLTTLLAYIAYAVDNARLLDESQESARQRQRVVDDLRATQAQLVRGETLSAIGKLASGMAHHLNNLFAVILGRLETLLVKVPADPEARRYIEIIQRAAQDGAEVVRRVQRFSRVQPVSRATPVDLNQLAQEVLEVTRPRWHNEAQLRQIRINTELHLGGIRAVAGEIAPLREVLMSLVLNAIDAMPGGGQLSLRTWSDAKEVHCAVSDTGSGMSDEVRQRAFEPSSPPRDPRARDSASPSPTASSSATTAGSISRPGWAAAPPCTSPCPRCPRRCAPSRPSPFHSWRRGRCVCSWSTTSRRSARPSPTCSALPATRRSRRREDARRWPGSREGSPWISS